MEFLSLLGWIGMPSSLDTCWRTLWKKIETDLHFSTSFHLQTDDQRDVMNWSLGNLLRCLVGDHSKGWDGVLPLAELAYNSSLNRTINTSPFELVYCSKPCSVVGFIPLPITNKGNIKVEEMAAFMQQLHAQVKA
ncbi:hypothetical protein CsSME_00035626 [Camellia sinensis var. sinensis]